MAKRRASREEFNMSAEIRAILGENKNLSGREVLEELQKRFPNQKINRSSLGVAFSNARRKLGLRRAVRLAVRRQRPGAFRVAGADGVNLDVLKAAKRFLSEAGSAAVAVEAIKQLETLQIG